MAGSASAAARASILTRLWTDATLLALTSTHPDDVTKARVYDEPPENAAFPYVVLGDVVERADNRMGGKVGRVLDIFVHAYTEKRGAKEAEDLLDRVDELLDNYISLSVTGYTVGLLNLLDTQYFRDARAGTPLRHGVSTYELHLLET